MIITKMLEIDPSKRINWKELSDYSEKFVNKK